MAVDLKSGRVELTECPNAGDRLDVVIVGDLCPRGRTEPLILDGRSDSVLADVMPVLAANDLSVVNLETVLTTADTPIPKSGPNLRVHPDCVQIIEAAGFDVACCANNHIGDYGPDEVVSTLRLCQDHDIDTVGAGASLSDAREPLIVERKGLRLALIAFAENEFGIADDDTPGANPLDPFRNIRDIRAAAAEADVTIVMVHGGNEYNPIPSPRMIATYRAFAEAGATAVVAGHPHTPQGVEVWGDVPIVYSPGNFLFDTRSDDPSHFWWTGYIVKLSFADHAVCALEVVPYTFGPDADKVRLLRDEERAEFLAYLDHISGVIPNREKVRRYWRAWCARMGPGVMERISGFPWPLNPEKPEELQLTLSLRNLLSCEAHNELLTMFLRMKVRGQVEEGAEGIPDLEALMEGRIPTQ